MKTGYLRASTMATVTLALMAVEVRAQDNAPLAGFASGGHVDITNTDLHDIVEASVCPPTLRTLTCVWTCSAEIDLPPRGQLDVDVSLRRWSRPLFDLCSARRWQELPVASCSTTTSASPMAGRSK